ncbi:hypothetical protein CDA63_12775 [Hymenobacter amundsenii]|uniref:Uncharacterized protein n=1 Tax=Hymenobacter amundsenii TaxID=2006685 RepID=A0A246FJP1_9BACT|nr:hypothetical protein CDA63_12775 [Hymenobacter amundsenii]
MKLGSWLLVLLNEAKKADTTCYGFFLIDGPYRRVALIDVKQKTEYWFDVINGEFGRDLVENILWYMYDSI